MRYNISAGLFYLRDLIIWDLVGIPTVMNFSKIICCQGILFIVGRVFWRQQEFTICTFLIHPSLDKAGYQFPDQVEAIIWEIPPFCMVHKMTAG